MVGLFFFTAAGYLINGAAGAAWFFGVGMAMIIIVSLAQATK